MSISTYVIQLMHSKFMSIISVTTEPQICNTTKKAMSGLLTQQVSENHNARPLNVKYGEFFSSKRDKKILYLKSYRYSMYEGVYIY